MTQNLIDDVHRLMKLTEDELNEVLIEKKYNKALLRELIRRSLKVANEYKQAFEYEKHDRKDTEALLRQYDGTSTEDM